jgi:hypothetical protein
LNCRQQQSDEDANDGNDDEQLDQREAERLRAVAQNDTTAGTTGTSYRGIRNRKRHRLDPLALEKLSPTKPARTFEFGHAPAI